MREAIIYFGGWLIGLKQKTTKNSQYRKLFLEFSNPAEKWMKRTILVLLLLLLVFQSLLVFPQLRDLLTWVARNEGALMEDIE